MLTRNPRSLKKRKEEKIQIHIWVREKENNSSFDKNKSKEESFCSYIYKGMPIKSNYLNIFLLTVFLF